jgi:hypothetical protein
MKLVTNVRTGDEPHDRLTQIAAAVGAAFEGHADRREGDKAIIVIEDDSDVGTMLNGYGDTAEAAITLIGCLQAMFPRLEVIITGDE